MLPVLHQACTLATGALRSSCTITVKPSGRTHFCAELGGKVMTAESSLAAAFKLAVLNIIATTAQVSNLRTQLLITLHLSPFTNRRRGGALADPAAARPRRRLVSRAQTASRTLLGS